MALTFVLVQILFEVIILWWFFLLEVELLKVLQWNTKVDHILNEDYLDFGVTVQYQFS